MKTKPTQYPMTSRTLLLSTAVALVTVAALAGSPIEPKKSKPRAATANSTNTFSIGGMHCTGCASGIASELRRTPGVAQAVVSFTNTTAIVAFDTNRVSTAALVKVVEEAGYKATPTP